jgi:hypothetical protein
MDRAPVSLAEIEARVRRLRDSLLEESEERLACGETLRDVWPGAPDNPSPALAQGYRDALARNDLGVVDGLMASAAVQALLPDDGERTQKLFRHTLLRALTELCDAVGELREGRFPPLGPSAPQPASLTLAPIAATASPSVTRDIAHRGPQRLFACWDKFADDMEADGNWRKHTRYQADGTKRLWLEVIGDLELADASRDPVEEFLRLLRRLPADYARAKRWRGMKLVEIADAADAAKVKNRLSLMTQARHLTVLSSYWVWLVTNTKTVESRGTFGRAMSLPLALSVAVATMHEQKIHTSCIEAAVSAAVQHSGWSPHDRRFLGRIWEDGLQRRVVAHLPFWADERIADFMDDCAVTAIEYSTSGTDWHDVDLCESWEELVDFG